MQVAIISDIHGNDVAFEAVLADMRGHPADQIVCLGDAIQGGPQPAQVARRLKDLGCPVVMGNADAWLLTGEETGREQITAERLRKITAIRAWSLAQLSDDQKAFIASFQPTVELPIDEGHSLLCFHGSPASYDDIILPLTPEEEFQQFLGAFSGHILTGGHTHVQFIRRIGDKFYFNPGSVGLAYSHHQPENQFRADPWAEYAVLTTDRARVGLEFRRVPFDVAELIRVYDANGRPYADEGAAQYRREG